MYILFAQRPSTKQHVQFFKQEPNTKEQCTYSYHSTTAPNSYTCKNRPSQEAPTCLYLQESPQPRPTQFSVSSTNLERARGARTRPPARGRVVLPGIMHSDATHRPGRVLPRVIHGRRTKAALRRSTGVVRRQRPLASGARGQLLTQSATCSAGGSPGPNEVWWSLASMRGTTLQEMV